VKRVIVSILAILYIGTSAGASVRMHFCMDQLISWQFGQETADKCEGCSMKKKSSQNDGCCKDEHQFLKSNSDQKADPLALQLVPIPVTALPSAYIGWLASRSKTVSQNNSLQFASPFYAGAPLYIRYAVFRI